MGTSKNGGMSSMMSNRKKNWKFPSIYSSTPIVEQVAMRCHHEMSPSSIAMLNHRIVFSLFLCGKITHQQALQALQLNRCGESEPFTTYGTTGIGGSPRWLNHWSAEAVAIRITRFFPTRFGTWRTSGAPGTRRPPFWSVFWWENCRILPRNTIWNRFQHGQQTLRTMLVTFCARLAPLEMLDDGQMCDAGIGHTVQANVEWLIVSNTCPSYDFHPWVRRTD